MHRILRQRIEWEAAGVTPATVGSYHARLEEFQERTFLPVLERWLDRHFGGSETWVIDRLELVVDLDGGVDLESVDGEAIQATLRKSISGSSEQVDKLTGDLNEPTPIRDTDGLSALVDYLRSGSLPLAYPTPQLLFRLPADWLSKIKKEELPALTILSERLRRLLVAVGTENAQVVNIITELSEHGKKTASETKDFPVTELPKPALVDHQPVRVIRKDSQRQPGLPESDSESIDHQAAGAVCGDLHRRPGLPESGSESQDILVDHYLPANAGIVLLHPYIDYLREQCGVSQNLSLSARLLHYAVFGHWADAEWDHPLTKVLLGLSPTDFLPEAEAPTTAQLRKVDDLLDGVLKHWGALGSTDRDGLRANFLHREGKLERNDREWSLTVDRQAYDLLLDRLPWALSPVKTGAMPRPLSVYWT